MRYYHFGINWDDFHTRLQFLCACFYQILCIIISLYGFHVGFMLYICKMFLSALIEQGPQPFFNFFFFLSYIDRYHIQYSQETFEY